MSDKEKSGLGGLVGLFKKPKKGCCDMESVEVEEHLVSKGVPLLRINLSSRGRQ